MSQPISVQLIWALVGHRSFELVFGV